jgi:transketolase
MTLIVPSDYNETKKATIAAGEMNGPVFIRFGRSAVPSFTADNDKFEIGKANILKDGNDLAIIAAGLTVWESLIASQMLENNLGIKARVINLHTIKPIDQEAIIAAAKDCGAIVTAEEHQIHGGMGSAVAEVVVANYPVPMKFVGINDRFGLSGEPDELISYFGLDRNSIYNAALDILKRK